MSCPVELRLCRNFPAQMHPLQVLIPQATFAALSPGPGPDSGTACVLSLHSGHGRGPALFTAASVIEDEPPREAGAPGIRDDGVAGAGGEGVTEPTVHSEGVHRPGAAGEAVTDFKARGTQIPGSGAAAEGVTEFRVQREDLLGPQTEGLSPSIGPFQIYTSKLFPAHYGLWVSEDKTLGQGVEAGLVSPQHGAPALLRASLVRSVPSLNRVVLGARTRVSLRWASSPAFANGLLVLACQRQPVLLRQGDAPIVPYHPLLGEDSETVLARLLELVVLECQPVLQGVLTVSTCLLLTDFREPGELPPAQPLHLLQPLCLSDFAHYARGLWASGLSLEPDRPTDFLSILRALECRLEVTVADLLGLASSSELRLGDRALDLDSCLLLNRRTLYRLGLFHCQWVLVSMPEPPTEAEQLRSELESPRPETGVQGQSSGWRPVTELLACVLVLEGGEGASLELGQDMAAISHTMWFNISKGAPVPTSHRALRVKRFYQGPELQKGLGESHSELCEPPVAEELHVEVVHSPTYDSRANYDGLIFQHFRTSRLVHVGAVLCVQTRGKPEFIESCTERRVGWPVIYLRVRSVSGGAESKAAPGYLADTEHTSVYLDGCGSSYVPCAVMSGGHPFWGSVSPPGLSSTVDTLCNIIEPYLRSGPPLLDRPCSVLLWGPSGCGKSTVVRAACSRMNLHLVKVDCVCLCSDSIGASEAKLEAAFSRAEDHRPCILLLCDVTIVGRERDGVGQDSRLISALQRFMRGVQSIPTNYPVVVVGTAVQARDVSADLQAVFLHELAVGALLEEQRKQMVRALSSSLPLGKDVNLAKIAKLTAGYNLSDLCTLLNRAGRAACRRLRRCRFPGVIPSEQEELELCAAGVTILQEDMHRALEELQAEHSQAIGAPKIPAVKWQDVGGLEAVKREILDTVQLPIEHPELLSRGLRRTGLLLYGPPGTGKTLLAKAVATECARTFLSVKGPELINMYVGQSEENVREVFSRARTASPCIVFFDELDSLAPNRGRSGDSGGVTDRVVSQLLAELDGLHSSSDVFVIGATNRPDLLDQALLRPGRLDKLLYVGLNEDRESQLRVLQAITRKFTLDAAVSLPHVVERCPPQLSGADLHSLCSEAMMSAVKRKIIRIDQGLDIEDSELALLPEDFDRALSTLQPSVSQQDLNRYRLIKQRLSTR
ncbi:peroxisomal ATPase PEX6 [Mobula hypostoma]|uniref:peroxisomal ATPase PEX6 n=1 Tax=Mobula hypostoma TaxID=723540 RepID=UPI002FC280F2